MGKLLRTLARVGLVELEQEPGTTPVDDSPGLDSDEIDRLLESEAEAAPAAPRPKVKAVPLGEGEQMKEGRPFAVLYADAKLPESPFSAEKLLRLLDGLKAMEPAVRQAAVRAMDEADEAWTLDDAVLDAERKTRALTDAAAQLEAKLQATVQRAQTDLAARDDYQAKAAASIRSQIAELEKMLEDELAKVAGEKATIAAQLEAARAACKRETARLHEERARLRQIPEMFAPPASSPPGR